MNQLPTLNVIYTDHEDFLSYMYIVLPDSTTSYVGCIYRPRVR